MLKGQAVVKPGSLCPQSLIPPVDDLQQNVSISSKRNFNDLLKKYQDNKSKYQNMLQKSARLGTSRFAPSGKTKKEYFLERGFITLDNSYEEDVGSEGEDGASACLKQVLGRKKCSNFRKRLDLSALEKDDRIKTLPYNNPPVKHWSVEDSGIQLVKRKTISSNYWFPKRLLPECPKPEQKAKNTQESKNKTSRSDQAGLPTRRKYKELDVGLTKSKQIKCEQNITKYLTQNIEEQEIQQKNLEKTTRFQNDKELYRLKDENRVLGESLQKAEAELELLVSKNNRLEETKELLNSSLRFQRGSYSTLLGHHNNEVLLLNSKIEGMEQDMFSLKSLNIDLNLEVQKVLGQNQNLRQEILTKDTQLKGLNLQLSEAKTSYSSRISQFETQVLSLNVALIQTKKQLEQRSVTTVTNQKALLSELRSAESAISTLKAKFQEMDQYVTAINSTKDPGSQNTLEGLLKQTFVKYQRCNEQLVRMKSLIVRYQSDIRSFQRIVKQLEIEVQYKQCSINEVKAEEEASKNKLKLTEKMLQTANDSLISKEIEMGNSRYQSGEVINDLKEENERLREEMEKIVGRLDQLESKIENREFQQESLGESDEDSFSLGRTQRVFRKVKFTDNVEESLDLIQAL